jgi:hypothetical protein
MYPIIWINKKQNMNKLFIGLGYGLIAQILTFLQLQGNIKWQWYQKYPMALLAMSVPMAWLYIKSVEAFVEHFNGEIWPSRLIGFGEGIIVFASMSYFMFGEAITSKTLICLVLAVSILSIQIFWK